MGAWSVSGCVLQHGTRGVLWGVLHLLDRRAAGRHQDGLWAVMGFQADAQQQAANGIFGVVRDCAADGLAGHLRQR